MIFLRILSNLFGVGDDDEVAVPFWLQVTVLIFDWTCGGGVGCCVSREETCLSISSIRPSALSADFILSQTRSASRSPLSLAPCSVDQYAGDVASPANIKRGSSALGRGVDSFSKSEEKVFK